jgi:hypothetical protein
MRENVIHKVTKSDSQQGYIVDNLAKSSLINRSSALLHWKRRKNGDDDGGKNDRPTKLLTILERDLSSHWRFRVFQNAEELTKSRP